MYMVSIDRDKCDGCGACVDACPAGILGMADDGKADVVGEAYDCMGCETCVATCPNEAYTVSEV
ncbi:4Fe-4S ferredoxin iron-sulfur binding domain-containing protein [Desulfotomaculum nigrificans CO-1-SRB]|uniref:4Fe-4S ferredoxin iron-sulfur binding domain-containing protein n=1 Tax=Desulfotomaculum nigrificans (strain DSM 14880 / VKM B-2319 / CO-1-SRB) TaxID=868595 RepID=F6B6Z0_DESCC|nr:4Fe-4S binding protein [Desulfotomaculum nigrificans]AEF93315.1 4Fe-4S ferredoxin iron-sulfur binding domain-containing protein [Desulfotomaculum nigrificans CO-1-SRB]